jgi:diguanylate cyclase (GGDEF)-like protein
MSIARIEAVLAAANDIAYEWDFATDTVTWFGPAERLFDSTGTGMPLTGKDFEHLIHPEDASMRSDALMHHYHTGEIYESEYRLQRNGLFSWVHERGGTQIGEDGKPVKLLGMMRSIDERKHREATLRHMVLFDSLTGQFNRSRLLDSVNERLLQTRRYHNPACYIVIGLDSFTPDPVGGNLADAEDAILIALSQHIETSLRASDIIGRVGKRDFGILLPHCPPGDIAVVAQKLVSKFTGREIQTTEGVFTITLSAGGVTLPGCALTGYDILNGGEQALATAQAQGGGTFVEFAWPEDVSREYHESVPVGERVLRALKESRVEFAFQPIVNSKTEKVVFYEALLRLWDEERNLIPAKDFIPAVERLGFSHVIDRRTLDLAIEELSRDPDLILALNISGVTVSDPAWLRKLNSQLRGRPQVAGRLIIEITETVAMKDMAQSVRFVNEIRELGCRVALDDFGAGFITFRHLKTLTVDIVKIDGALVQNLMESPDKQAFVRTLVDLAHAFHLKIVAEFVESQAEAEHLRDQGVTFLQGYYFGKPSMERPWLNRIEAGEAANG